MNIAECSPEFNAAGFALGVIFASVLVLYFPVLLDLAADWGSNDNYSHGYFIPFISLYMVWHERDRFKRIPARPADWGLVVVLLGLLQLVLGYMGSEFFLQRTSLITVIAGIIIFCLGTQYFRFLLVPVLYLLFMIPLPAIIWNKIAFPMQLFSSYLAEHVVSLCGLSILRQGNILSLPSTTLEVVDACSGLRSLMTMFALSSFLTWQAKFVPWKKMVLFLSAAPIAVISNTIRLCVTAVLASFYGGDVAQGFLHEFSGLVTFGLGIIMLIAVNHLLRPR